MNQQLMLAAAVFVVLVFPSAAEGARRSQTPSCHVSTDIGSGKTITVVRQKGLGRPVKGVYASSDEIGVTIEEAATGERILIPWGSVRKIKGKNAHAGLWSGMFIGTALAAASLLGDEPPGAGLGAAFVGIGASAGAIAGQFADRPICKTPKGEAEQAPPSSAATR